MKNEKTGRCSGTERASVCLYVKFNPKRKCPYHETDDHGIKTSGSDEYLFKKLLERPINELVLDYMYEVSLKNQVYQYILDGGLRDDYTNYLKFDEKRKKKTELRRVFSCRNKLF